MYQEPDADTSKLCTRRLWELLRLVQGRESELDPMILESIRGELLARDEEPDPLYWKEPH